MMNDAALPGSANLPIGDGALTDANREIGVPGGIDGSSGPGWYSRGYLPHYDRDVTPQHVTFHLADSLPREVVQCLDEELKNMPSELQDVERRKRVEAWLDSGHGSCVLREPRIARMVEGSLLFFDGQRYRLLAWVVMPNHVHVLFQPMCDWRVAQTMASWKKFTATRICAFRREATPGSANLPIGDEVKAGWHREYWDRFIRDNRHYQQAVEYIHQNPVKAGLVEKAEAWPWSSARLSSCGDAFANREIGVPGNSS